MCDPVTLTIAATAVMATGKIVQGIGESQQARYQASVDEQNARIASNQARDSIENTNIEALRRSRETARTRGAQEAAMAANGISLDFGSAVDVQKDTAMIGAEDLSQIYKGGNERTKGFEINAFNYKASAAANRAKAKGALINAGFGALGTALGGASQASGMNAAAGGGGGFSNISAGTASSLAGQFGSMGR